ncbi:MAG: DedA family protein [Nitrososphaerota archaeon]|nr:DedA family protein [Nitrososphaerota archaeon]
MSLSAQIFNFVVNMISSSGYAGIFALMTAEGATLPVPSEVILPFAGYLVFEGQLNFWVVVVVATVGSIIGAFIDYFIGYYLGRAAVLRYGRYIRLNEGHLKTVEKWFSRYGEITVLFSKFVPLVRTLVSFPAGAAEMKVWKFALFSAIGSIIWNVVLVYVGFVAGQNATKIISTLSGPYTATEIVVVILIIVGIVYFLERKSSKQA